MAQTAVKKALQLAKNRRGMSSAKAKEADEALAIEQHERKVLALERIAAGIASGGLAGGSQGGSGPSDMMRIARSVTDLVDTLLLKHNEALAV